MRVLSELIEKSKSIITNYDTTNSIKSLYIDGSIKPEDRTKNSDIDVIGIVDDDFPGNREAEINRDLKESIPEMKCKLRVLYLSELHGGKTKSFISSLLPVQLFLRRIPLFPLIWGDPLNIDETIGPYTYDEEIRVQISLILRYITNQNSIKPIPFEWIPKAVVYLSAIESALFNEEAYSTSFSEIQYQWKNDREHIVHDCIKIRNFSYALGKVKKDEFINKVYEYLKMLSLKLGVSR
jgi:hypothetical protein